MGITPNISCYSKDIKIYTDRFLFFYALLMVTIGHRRQIYP